MVCPAGNEDRFSENHRLGFSKFLGPDILDNGNESLHAIDDINVYTE